MIRYMQIAFLGALAVLLSVVASGSAQAQTLPSLPNNNQNADLTLNGFVPEILQVVVAPIGANDFDLTLDQAMEIKAATVKERANTSYKVTVDSANLSSGVCSDSGNPCFHSPTTGEALDFDVSKGLAPAGSFLTFTSNQATWSDSTSKTLGDGETNDLNIAYSGFGDSLFLSAADDYTETLTFTITAK